MASSVCNRHSLQNPEGTGITGLQIIYLFSYIFWSNASDTETASSVSPDSSLTFHQRLFHQQIFFAASCFLWLSCVFQQILVSFNSNVNEKGNSVFDHKVSEAASLQLPPGTERPKQLCTHQDIYTEAESGRAEANDQETPHLCTSRLEPTTALFHTRSVWSLHNIPIPVQVLSRYSGQRHAC